MSRSIKTRELFFQSLNSNVANNTTGSWSPIVINIPETNPVFKNVIAEVYCDDDATVVNNNDITKRALTFNLGTVTPIHINNTQTIADSGENISFQHSYDITSHFVSNWSGTNLGASASFVYTGAPSGSSNWGLRLCMTYEYDMNSPTQSKTIFFPIGVRNDYLATTSSLGTFPALTQFLPESNININQVNFIYEVNGNRTGTGDLILGFQIENEPVHYSSTFLMRNATARTRKYIYSTTNFNTGSSNEFKIYCNSGSVDGYCPHVYVAVDYQYNPSSSRILNSVRVPFHFENQFNISIDSSTYIRQRVNYLVNEPGEIVPTTSSVFIYNTKGSTTTLTARFRTDTGSSFFVYQSMLAGTGLAGYYTTPITSSNGFGIKKGRNELYIDFFKSNQSPGGGLSGLYLLNYYSDNGDVNKHNKTIVNNFLNHNNTGSQLTIVRLNHNIWMPESASYYYLNSIGDEYNYIMAPTVTQFNLFYSKSLGELGENNQNTLDSVIYDLAEIGNKKFYTSTDSLFKKTNGDITRNLHPTQSRTVTFINAQSATCYPSNATYYTYNTISFQVSGSVSNTSGGTIYLDLYRDYDNKKIQTQTRTGNGTYSFLVPDGEDTYYVIAKDGATNKVSKIDYPISGSFDITFGLDNENYETFF